VKTTDAPVITAWKQDPYITKMKFDHGHVTNEAEQRHDISRALKSQYKEYKIIEHDGKPIGYIRINWQDVEKRIGWIRLALGEERGHGYGKEALSIYIRELFDSGVLRIEGEVYEYNIPAQRLMEQFGFKKEGVRRKAHFTGDEYCDIYVYGLLHDD